MSSFNPQSVPGGWKKDTSAAEQSNPAAGQKAADDVPRSLAGTVNDAGDIVDQSGNAVGKIADSKDPKDLVGNSVTATGDVVSSAGDVLGKATLGGGAEKDTSTGDDAGADTPQSNQEGQQQEQQEQQEQQQQQSQSGGFFGRTTKGAFNAVSGLGKGLANLNPQQLANLTPQQKKEVEEQGGDVEKVQEQAQQELDQTKEGADDTAGKAQEQGQETTEAANEAADDTTDQAKSAINLEDREQTGDDVQGKVGEGAELAEDQKKTCDGKADDTTGELKDTEKAGEEKVGDLKDDAEKNVDEKPQDIKDDADKVAGDLPEGEKPGDDDKGDDENRDDDEKRDDDKDIEGKVEGEVPQGEEAEKALEGEEKPSEVGHVVDGDPEQVQGKHSDENGQILDDDGNVVGKAEPGDKLDFSILKGATVNKVGNIINSDGYVVGRIIEGEPKKLQGKRVDKDGQIWDDSGNVLGKAEPLPDNEREDLKKDFAPFENFPGAVVEADGTVTFEGKRVGTVVDGDPKRIKGSKVDEDGDILDRNGNVVGKAEAWDEPEAEPEEIPDRSILAGKRVNKAGNVVDSAGVIFGKVVEGNVSSMVGRMCNKEGNVLSESGDVIGKAEVVPEGEREGSKEGPFAELSGLTITKEGKVVTPGGDVVGRLVQGDGKTLFGRNVDEDGDVVDKNGNTLGKAERWEEPEVEKKKGPLAGYKVNREGNVCDEDGNIIAKLVNGDVLTCAGKEIDDDGDVVNAKGNTVGHCALLEDIPEPEESAEDKEKREEAEKDKKLAQQLAGSVEQSLDKIRPICKMITDKIDKAERTPKEELDEEEVVKGVKPLIEEAGKILTETNGVIRGLDPDGRIQRNAKQKASTREATPEEYHVAEVIKELTGTVTETVDNAKRKIEDMPHAKKELNPLWGLLTEPLFQIIAAVGLLLNGVLGILGRLLSGLGLGGLVDGLLGGLGLDKILGGLGLGSAYDSLTGKK